MPQRSNLERRARTHSGMAHAADGRPRGHLAGVPRTVRFAALLGVAATGAYVATYLAVRALDPDRAAAMLRMYFVTIAAGRETAMFDAMHGGLPPTWTFVLSVLDDVGSLMIALAVAWIALSAIKAWPAARWAFAHLEKQAILHRPTVQRLGLGGLALLYYLPGFGAGVPLTALLAVLSRIPMRRLVPFFVIGTLLIDGGWTILLSSAERSVPNAPLLDYLPLLVLAVVVTATAIGAWRGRKERHVVILDFPPEAMLAQAARLRAAGIQLDGGLLRADLEHLRGRVPFAMHRGRLMATAELMLLNDMTAEEAANLVKAGVPGLDAMARRPRRLARLAIDPAFPVLQLHTDSWVEQARALVGAQNAGWRTRT